MDSIIEIKNLNESNMSSNITNYSLESSINFINPNELIVAKLISIIILGLGSLIFGLFPIIIKRKNNNFNNFSNITSTLMYFGGGVLLATTFLHLLPEVNEQIEILKKKKYINDKFPYGEFLMCCGFFIMFIIESIVHMCMENNMHEHTHGHSEVKNINVKTKNYKTCNHTVEIINPNESHSEHSHDYSQLLRSGSIRNLLMILALSIHEMFEGLAIGLELMSSQVYYLLLGVSFHKFIIAFCLGFQISSNTMNITSYFSLNIIYVFLFSICSPIGIAIGMTITMVTLVSSSSVLEIYLSVLLQGIATGSLLYIVFFEILKSNTHVQSHNKIKTLLNLIFLLTGFILMASVQYILAD